MSTPVVTLSVRQNGDGGSPQTRLRMDSGTAASAHVRDEPAEAQRCESAATRRAECDREQGNQHPGATPWIEHQARIRAQRRTQMTHRIATSAELRVVDGTQDVCIARARAGALVAAPAGARLRREPRAWQSMRALCLDVFWAPW